MKVSKAQQVKIRAKIIESGTFLFLSQGLEKTSMRAIAEKAGFSTATIYNYFPNREKILYAFFELKAQQTMEALSEIPDIEEFSLKEKLQAQLETTLDLYLEDREFVIDAHKLFFKTPMKMFSELEEARNIHIAFIEETLEAAIQSGEISEQPFPKLLTNLYWDYAVLMIIYWTKDESPGFEKSSQLIDMTLDLIIEFMKSNLLSKTSDIALFIFKSHFQKSIEDIDGIFDTIEKLRGTFKES